MNNARRHDDIDLMIVTASQRVWLTRAVVLAVTSILGGRRSWRDDSPQDFHSQPADAGKWCFNLWVSQDHLTLPSHQRTIYAAYELCQAEPLLDRGDTHWQLLMANRWAKQFVPQYWRQRAMSAPRAAAIGWAKVLDYILSPIWWWLDWLLYQLQWQYMQPHMTSEHVERSVAFFHPRQTKKLVLQRWRQSLIRALNDQGNSQ